MKPGATIEQLLRWRLARAEAEAPRPPRAALLLELARPWWEIYPARFKAFLEGVGKIEIAYGHAMAETRQARCRHPVPALIVRADKQIETFARVLYISVQEGQLRFRFELDAVPESAEPMFEVTFVSNSPARPLFSAHATWSVESEYRLDAEISAEVMESWEHLRVTDRMPFRLILRAGPDGG